MVINSLAGEYLDSRVAFFKAARLFLSTNYYRVSILLLEQYKFI
jgi:hypothetical protein